ncbi:MAG TPA: ABC transporter permease, partial [Propionicimonas sp.]
MITTWLGGLLRRRGGRLAAVALGIALAVGLTAALSAFLGASKTTMTQRAVQAVAVDWQVQVQPGAAPGDVMAAIAKDPGNTAALPVSFAQVAG